MAKKLKIDDTVTVAVTPTSRFMPTIEGYLAEYERLLKEEHIALEHEEWRDAFVLRLQREAIEDQLRSSFNREKFWAQ